MEFVFDADEDFLLGGAAREIARFGAMTSASEAECLGAIDGVFYSWLEDGFGVVIIIDAFVKCYIDAA